MNGRSADIKIRLQFLEALISGSDSDIQKERLSSGFGRKDAERSFGDTAAAQRVLQAAMGIMKQLGKTSGHAVMVLEQDLTSGGAAEEDGGGISLDEEEDEEVMEIPEAGQDGVRMEPQPTASSLRGFHAAWTSQMAKEGLVGALVALAYPDRVAV